MTGMEWKMLAAGFVFVAVLGAWHLGGILLSKRIKPSGDSHPWLSVLVTFWTLLLLHGSEIALGALAFATALSVPGAGAISEGYGSDAAGLLYFAGINFTTLGYTQQTVEGPIRLLVVLQSLGGLMLITWSATFAYTVWADQFREDA